MRRWWPVGLLLLAVIVAGCGGGAGDVDTSAPRAETDSAPAPEPGTQVVRYQGIELTVPAAWPVHDLEAAPTTCVRFDVNAVYLGSPSPDMECPAQAIGRADAVLVEPGAGAGDRARNDLANAPASEVNGLSIAVDSSRVIEHELVVAVPQASVTVTVSFSENDSVAQQIIATMRAAR